MTKHLIEESGRVLRSKDRSRATAVQLLHELDGPTVLVGLDRLDLIEQTTSEFLSAGIPRVRVADRFPATAGCPACTSG